MISGCQQGGQGIENLGASSLGSPKAPRLAVDGVKAECGGEYPSV